MWICNIFQNLYFLQFHSSSFNINVERMPTCCWSFKDIRAMNDENHAMGVDVDVVEKISFSKQYAFLKI